MRTRDSLLSICAVLAACLAPGPRAYAGWSSSGATIKSTNNSIPKLAAAYDGALGTIVAWQEESSAGSGVLRAQHVLATGDPDPAWASDGALLCNTSTSRRAIGVVPDQLGGSYVWWLEGNTLYLSRVDANGAVAGGWPARGRMLGSLAWSSALPSAISDGAHGVYLAWTTMALDPIDEFHVNAVHLGPSNTGAGGWSNGVRALSGGDAIGTAEYWPHLALAPDGGLFAAWATWSANESYVTSAYRLRRFTSAGLNAAGWPTDGLDLGAFQGALLNPAPGTGLVGLSPDGRGGVFALLGVVTGTDGYNATLETRLFRLQGDGSTAVGWPAAGSLMSNGPTSYQDAGIDASYRVSANGLDGAHAGVPDFYDHGTDLGFRDAGPNGSIAQWSEVGGSVPGVESIEKGDGGLFVAGFNPSGPYGPYQPYAFLSVQQSAAPAGWTNFLEIHYEPVIQWYGDIALASSGDGGAILFWSQVNVQHGLFARRFNAAGEVTGVPDPGPIASTLALSRLRFVAGEGVRVGFSLAGGDAARLDLFDVGGRRVASSRLERFGAGAHEVALDGTAALPSGLYFARLASARANASGRVIVTH